MLTCIWTLVHHLLLLTWSDQQIAICSKSVAVPILWWATVWKPHCPVDLSKLAEATALQLHLLAAQESVIAIVYDVKMPAVLWQRGLSTTLKKSFENSFDFMIVYYRLWSSSISVAPNLLSFQVQFPLFPFPLQQTNIAQSTDSISPNSSVGIESSFVKLFKYAFHLFPLVLWLL